MLLYTFLFVQYIINLLAQTQQDMLKLEKSLKLKDETISKRDKTLTIRDETIAKNDELLAKKEELEKQLLEVNRLLQKDINFAKDEKKMMKINFNGGIFVKKNIYLYIFLILLKKIHYLLQWFPNFLMPRTPKIFKFVLAPLASKFSDFFKNNLN